MYEGPDGFASYHREVNHTGNGNGHSPHEFRTGSVVGENVDHGYKLDICLGDAFDVSSTSKNCMFAAPRQSCWTHH